MDRVHIVTTRLDSISPTDKSRYWALLSEEEREKASRLRGDLDRDRSAAARAILRMTLSEHVGDAPDALTLSVTENGKPFLCRGDERPFVDFNVSHSEDVLLLGVSTIGRIGVDVERVWPQVDWRKLASRFYSRDEISRLHALPEAAALRTFIIMWTVKEAFLKATGQGISIPLSEVETAVSDQGDIRSLRALNGDATNVADWRVISLDTFPGFVATVVYGTMSLVK